MTELVLSQDHGRVRLLTLNSPATLNALSRPMLAALGQAFDDLATAANSAANAPRVVVLRGSGRAFCAGHDLREIQAARQAPDQGAAAFAELFEHCAEVMQKIPALPQPVIAQVHGIATAAGCQLAASCDLVVAGSQARFGVNGVNIGLFCSTPMVALSRKVGASTAFEMLVTGEFLSAERAQAAGLVNRVSPEDRLEQDTFALAETIAGKLAAAVRIGKRAFYEQLGLPLDRAYANTGAVMTENLLLRDASEGISAFLEKRPPDWA